MCDTEENEEQAMDFVLEGPSDDETDVSDEYDEDGESEWKDGSDFEPTIHKFIDQRTMNLHVCSDDGRPLEAFLWFFY